MGHRLQSTVPPLLNSAAQSGHAKSIGFYVFWPGTGGVRGPREAPRAIRGPSRGLRGLPGGPRDLRQSKRDDCNILAMSLALLVCLSGCLSLSLSLFLSLRLSVSLLSLSSKRGLPPCLKPRKSYHPTLAAQPIHTLLSPAFAGNGAADLALLQWSAGPIQRSNKKLQNLNT